MKHNYLSLLLALLMSMVASVASAHDFEVDGIYYKITSEENLTVSVTYRGTYYYDYDNEYTGSVTIPASVTYNGTKYGVTSIGYRTFYDCSGLTSITIPEGVVSIGEFAFYSCTGLTSITIPEGVTSIGNYAFSYCSGLISITIPDGVVSIGESAFSGCNGLSSITIPEGVTSIGDYAFSGCSGLTSITIPASVTSIGNAAFSGCTGLTSITIPEGITSIGYQAFDGCSGLTSITISEGVTSIGEYAFEFCRGLTSITIPSSVTSIGEGAFSRCWGLTSVIVADGNTVYDSRNNCNAIIETSSNTIIAGCQNTFIPESVTSIGNHAFDYCRGLTSITIPESVTSIGVYAFYECSGLTSITIPESVTSIGISAFFCCSGLTSVTALNTTPITISSDTFSNRANATLYVPQGCKSAYEAANYWKEFKEIQELPITITVGSTGMATYCSPYDLDFTDSDARAYIVSGFTPSTAQVILTRVYDVKAGTGIVVKAAAGSYEIPVKAAETIVSNMLRGVTEPTILNKVEGDYTNYILAKKNDVLGFYAVTDGSTLGANKAYLPLLTSALPAAAEVKLMLVFDDEGLATGIEAPEKQEAAEDAIYNLNGQRLSRLQKGVNIVGGKKLFIK
ncbi:MAG: leucine-rich repeat domain-containing protein [Bacteroidaceae bacterium]|nr:leucine-rich repeat domain-containing protein [Bacteroidaceae bacterium]